MSVRMTTDRPKELLQRHASYLDRIPRLINQSRQETLNIVHMSREIWNAKFSPAIKGRRSSTDRFFRALSMRELHASF